MHNDKVKKIQGLLSWKLMQRGNKMHYSSARCEPPHTGPIK